MYDDKEGFDTSFRIHLGLDQNMTIGDKRVYVDHDDIIVNNEVYMGTPGLWPLVTRTRPAGYSQDDLKSYAKLMLQTNALNQDLTPRTTTHDRVDLGNGKNI